MEKMTTLWKSRVIPRAWSARTPRHMSMCLDVLQNVVLAMRVWRCVLKAVRTILGLSTLSHSRLLQTREGNITDASLVSTLYTLYALALFMGDKQYGVVPAVDAAEELIARAARRAAQIRHAADHTVLAQREAAQPQQPA